MIILLMFTVIVGSIVGAAFLLPPTYRSTAKVMVNFQSDNEKAFLLGLSPTGSRRDYDRLGSEVVIVKVRNILEPVVNALGLDKPEDGTAFASAEEAAMYHDKAIEKLEKKLKVEREKDTNVLSISYEDKNPALAARVVDKVITEYITQRPSLDRDDRAFDFFDKQIQVIKNQIDEIEKKGMEYKSRERVLLPDKQTQILFSSIAEFDKELTRIRAERISKEAKLKIIREQMTKGTSIVVPTTETSESMSRYDYVNELKKKLLDLDLKRNVLETQYTPKHPKLASVLAEIKETKKKLRAEVDEIIRAEETSIKALIAAESALAQRMNQVVNSVAKLSEQEYELGKLTIGIDDLKSVYSMLIRQREEARIASNKKEYLVQVRLLEPAMVPYKPVKPNKPLMAGLGVLLGLIVSLGFAFFLEYFDHSVNTAEDAQNCLGLPILAVIPDFQVRSTAQLEGATMDDVPSRDFSAKEQEVELN